MASLHRHFPENFPLPEFLSRFAEWLDLRAYGSVGYFQSKSERFNDFWTTNGADLHGHFAFFLKDPTGGQIGFWLFDGVDRTNPPIVYVGSEGETIVIADRLGLFLYKMTSGETGIVDLDETDDDLLSERMELAEFVGRHISEFQCRSDHLAPDFEQWMANFREDRDQHKDTDQILLEIGRILRKYRRATAEEWETEVFEVVLVGQSFAIWRRHFGLNRLPQGEIAELEPLFRQARENRAVEFPERGLWMQSSVEVGATGGAWLRCGFLNRPEIDDQAFEILETDFANDLRRWPRSRQWLAGWV